MWLGNRGVGSGSAIWLEVVAECDTTKLPFKDQQTFFQVIDRHILVARQSTPGTVPSWFPAARAGGGRSDQHREVPRPASVPVCPNPTRLRTARR